MTETEYRKYLLFLDAKVSLLSRRMDTTSASGFLALHSQLVKNLSFNDPSSPAYSQIRDYDRELELMTRPEIGTAAIDAVAAELKKQFGFGRIADDPDVVLKRVARRRKIANDEELRIVLDALSIVDDSIEPKLRDVVDAAARRYEGLDKWGPLKRIDR